MGRRKSSTGGSDYEGSASGSVDLGGSKTSGGRKGRGGGSDFEEELLEVDPFDAAVEQLYEKRAATRETALSTIVTLLAQFRYDDCAFRQDTLTQLFLSSIRKGKEAEVCLAAKALGLHVATLGAGPASEAIYTEAEPMLEPLILTGKSAAARAAAVDALTVLCFVGSEGTTDTQHTMQTLWRVVRGAAAAWLVVSALRGWAFLLTTVPSYQLTAHFVEEHLSVLARLLHSGDVEVRGAAGESIAVLWELGDLSSLPESPRRPASRGNGNGRGGTFNSLAAMAVGSPPKAAMAVPAAVPAAAVAAAEEPPPAAAAAAAAAAPGAPLPFGSPIITPGMQLAAAAAAAAAAAGQPPAGAEAAPAQQAQAEPQLPKAKPEPAAEEEEEEEEEGMGGIEAIVERMRDLAKNRGDVSRLNKGDRASMRGTFRDLLAIIEGEYVPEQKIKLRHGDLLMVSGLLDNIRLNYIRGYLAEAFQSHLQSNELLHEVFHFQPAEEPEEKLSPIEKRLFRSKSSTDVRERSELRKKERAQMASYKHGCLSDY